MTTALVQRSVDFYGDELVVIHQDGVDYTPVKPVCDILGIDWESQRQRIARDEVLISVACVIQATGADGKRYDMLCLPLDYLNGWLFGVDVGRIRPSLRERLILYKRECYRALARAFGASGEGAAPLARVVALEERVAVLEGRGWHQLASGQATHPVGAIVGHLVITGNPDDRLTGSEIATALAARGIIVAATQRGAEVIIAQVLRRLGARCTRPCMQGTASRRRTWFGVRLVAETPEEGQ